MDPESQQTRFRNFTLGGQDAAPHQALVVVGEFAEAQRIHFTGRGQPKRD